MLGRLGEVDREKSMAQVSVETQTKVTKSARSLTQLMPKPDSSPRR